MKDSISSIPMDHGTGLLAGGTDRRENHLVQRRQQDGEKPLRLIYFSPFEAGGLADYAHEQANALQESGVQVMFLSTPAAIARKKNAKYQPCPQLMEAPRGNGSRSLLARRIGTTRYILKNVGLLLDSVRREGADRVLFCSYSEYLAPLWAPRLKQLARRGVVFGSVIHDPVRSFVVGPVLWHRWSVACGYSFLKEAFVHEAIELDTGSPAPRLRTTVIPHGPYSFPPSGSTRANTRDRLGIPRNARVLLSFGHIRDAKNLDLTLRALARCPDFYLLVAGQASSASQKPVSHYRELAANLGVAGRCRWEARHIGEDEVGGLFEAADLILLTYGAEFRSASGVLNAAVQFRKTCLTSSGQGNLKSVVEKYGLGVWIESDSESAIIQGLQGWPRNWPTPDWDRYAAENSWRRNAALVKSRMFVGAGVQK